jgi:MFS family permease
LFSLYAFEFDDPLVVAIVLAFASMSEAFTNVVSDAIMVIQSRRDPNFGSQDFITLMWLTVGVGGAAGCIIGGLLTEYCHPKWSFYLYSFVGIIISFAACFLTKDSETNAKVARPTNSEASSELLDYEAEQRTIMIKNGDDPEVVKNRRIPKRKGFWYNLGQNCKQIGRAITMREIF